MVDITSLKVRLARLRLGSEFEDKHPELADPVTIDRKKKKKQKKASKDPYNEYTKNTDGKRKKKNKLTRSDQKRAQFPALPDIKLPEIKMPELPKTDFGGKTGEGPTWNKPHMSNRPHKIRNTYGVDSVSGNFDKSGNRLNTNSPRAVPKRGRDRFGKTRKAQDPYNQYTKNTGGKRKKNNKLTRSDKKRS